MDSFIRTSRAADSLSSWLRRMTFVDLLPHQVVAEIHRHVMAWAELVRPRPGDPPIAVGVEGGDGAAADPLPGTVALWVRWQDSADPIPAAVGLVTVVTTSRVVDGRTRWSARRSCRARTRKGLPCPIGPRPSGLCHVHDPTVQCGATRRDGHRCAAPTGGVRCRTHRDATGLRHDAGARGVAGQP
ncbi:hypothetical protein [Asanoa sp. NPDC050611]|uniref:hypothetical protein n=1 Tax=Asanoa sp. NPDC050611 TaxID=3157098 RepID=UPI003405BA3B